MSWSRCDSIEEKNAASEQFRSRALLWMLMKGFEPPTYALRMRCSTS